MGTIYKRGEVYWGYWRDADGAKHQASLKTSDAAVARERLRGRELTPTDRSSHGPPLAAALSYLLDKVYAGRPAGTLNCYSTKARHLLRLLGPHADVRSLRREHVVSYRATRIAEGAAETTIAKELVVLRLALREQGVEGVVPRASPRYVPRERHLTPAEAEKVLGSLPERRRPWFMVAIYAGLRAAELERLTWEDVDWDGGWPEICCNCGAPFVVALTFGAS